VALAGEAPGFLAAYDLILIFGQFEYVPHEVLAQLAGYLDSGGDLFAATHEFAIFRVRLEPQGQLTTYKWDWESTDPFALPGDPALAHRIAGVGMNSPASYFESEIIGQTVWAAHHVTNGIYADVPLFHTSDVAWILEGTAFDEVGALPGAFANFASGNLLDFDAGQPSIHDFAFSRTPMQTVVWAALQSPDARAWWQAAGRNVADWPLIQNGYATATLQQRQSGSRIVTLPSPNLVNQHLADPRYQRLLLNVVRGIDGTG
jgi:hypothetical protein